MSVYVDHAFAVGDWGRWTGGGHLQADTVQELHAFASRLGLRREWFQSTPGRPEKDHYDLTRAGRALAIRYGATGEDRRTGTRRRQAIRRALLSPEPGGLGSEPHRLRLKPVAWNNSGAMTKRELTEAIQTAMGEQGLSFAQLAEALGRPPLWTAAAVLGQHPFPADVARALVDMLSLPAGAVPALEAIPTRGALEAPVPTDPTIYRLYEVLQVYGPALKALIHEEFGDGIMSAINFRAGVERVPDPAGDRVRITLDGKFLPYQWD